MPRTRRLLSARAHRPLLVAALLVPRAAYADLPPATSACPPCPCAASSAGAQPPAADSQRLQQAKVLFIEGNELRKAGDCERGVDRFLRSRALVPSVSNTLNAAWCLQQIGRADESLELYEDVLTRFRESLSTDERASIGPTLALLRKQVGSMDVSSDVAGTLVIDGRSRGRLPLAFPVRVLPGSHVVRVLADGWQTFEKTVNVRAGETASVDAKLAPLARAGRLRIAGPQVDGAQLYVDGALVGEAPWEGTLSSGPHVIALRKGDKGTAPVLAQVLESQTAAPMLELAAGVADVQITTDPPSASIAVDGVPLGHGRWLGWLPAGSHTITGAEAGYFSGERKLNVAGAAVRASLALQVDQKHPIWDVRRADLAARLSNERTGDEIAFLYLTAIGYGVGTGLWLDAQINPSSVRQGVLPPLLIGLAVPASVYALDNIGKPLRYGLPQSIAEGVLIGAEEGGAWAWYAYAHAPSGKEPEVSKLATAVWGSATVGAAAGGLLGATLDATPGRASFVGSTALWGGVIFGLTTGSVGKNDENLNDRIAFATGVGIAAGTVGGVVAAGPVSPSAARVRLIDLGALGGGVLFAGGYMAATENWRDAQPALAFATAGVVLGGAGALWLTRNMPPDRPATSSPGPAPGAVTILPPEISPIAGGAVFGMRGTF